MVTRPPASRPSLRRRVPTAEKELVSSLRNGRLAGNSVASRGDKLFTRHLHAQDVFGASDVA